MSELRVAFVRMGPHPIPNRLLPPELARALGGARLEILDLEARMRRDPVSLLLNPLFVVTEHGWNLLRGRLRPWQAFFTTTFMFRRMSSVARQFVRRGDYDLSFQMQSLFDARLPGTPHFVYTDHTHLENLRYPDFDRRTLRGPRWIALERALYAGAAVVFARSRNILESLIRDYDCSADQVVCAGAGSNARVPTGPAAAADTAAPNLLFVGADWERKGGPELVAAFERLRTTHGGLRLTIVGCRPAIDLPGVDVVGPCPVESVHRHYEGAAIFCLPTRREPFGVAIVEAMHHGLPIVATRIGAVPELVEEGENGYLVDAGDVDALVARLGQLLADPAGMRALGDRSRRRARSFYTWPAVAARMAEAIRPRIKRGAGRAAMAATRTGSSSPEQVARTRHELGITPPASGARRESAR